MKFRQHDYLNLQNPNTKWHANMESGILTKLYFPKKSHGQLKIAEKGAISLFQEWTLWWATQSQDASPKHKGATPNYFC